MNNFPIIGAVEKSVAENVTKLVGTDDINLNTILKLSILNEMNKVDTSIIENITNSIKAENMYEATLINQEYGLTYDMCGNLVSIFEEVAEEVEEVEFYPIDVSNTITTKYRLSYPHPEGFP